MTKKLDMGHPHYLPEAEVQRKERMAATTNSADYQEIFWEGILQGAHLQYFREGWDRMRAERDQMSQEERARLDAEFQASPQMTAVREQLANYRAAVAAL